MIGLEITRSVIATKEPPQTGWLASDPTAFSVLGSDGQQLAFFVGAPLGRNLPAFTDNYDNPIQA